MFSIDDCAVLRHFVHSIVTQGTVKRLALKSEESISTLFFDMIARPLSDNWSVVKLEIDSDLKIINHDSTSYFLVFFTYISKSNKCTYVQCMWRMSSPAKSAILKSPVGPKRNVCTIFLYCSIYSFLGHYSEFLQ